MRNAMSNDSRQEIHEQHCGEFYSNNGVSCDVLDSFITTVTDELGKDLMAEGIEAFIVRLVGPQNAEKLWARHAGELRGEPPCSPTL